VHAGGEAIFYLLEKELLPELRECRPFNSGQVILHYRARIQDGRAWHDILCATNMQRYIGVILIVLGIITLIWSGFSYTQRKKVVDAGPVHISADQKKDVNWPPYTGAILLVAGIVVFATGRGRN